MLIVLLQTGGWFHTRIARPIGSHLRHTSMCVRAPGLTFTRSSKQIVHGCQARLFTYASLDPGASCPFCELIRILPFLWTHSKIAQQQIAECASCTGFWFAHGRTCGKSCLSVVPNATVYSHVLRDIEISRDATTSGEPTPQVRLTCKKPWQPPSQRHDKITDIPRCQPETHSINEIPHESTRKLPWRQRWIRTPSYQFKHHIDITWGVYTVYMLFKFSSYTLSLGQKCDGGHLF